MSKQPVRIEIQTN